jgi:hypothetical protein
MNCLFVQHPSRLSFGEKYEVLDVSAGYGFSIFIVKSIDDSISLFGTGINSDSQIGYHKHPGKTNKVRRIKFGRVLVLSQTYFSPSKS